MDDNDGPRRVTLRPRTGFDKITLLFEMGGVWVTECSGMYETDHWFPRRWLDSPKSLASRALRKAISVIS